MEIIQAILEWDEIIYKYITEALYDPLSFFFFQIITNFLDVIALVLALFFLFFGIWKIRSSKSSQIIFNVLAVVTITAIITLALKMLFQRGAPVPYVIPWLEIKVPFAIQYAFPSGHTSRAFAFAWALSYQVPDKRVLLVSAAVLIGFSRVYIGAHFPLDVVAGAALGIFVAWSLARLIKNVSKQPKPTKIEQLNEISY